MTELERYKAVYEYLFNALELYVSTARLEEIAKEATAILTPAPIMEEVEEVVGWVNVYPDSYSFEDRVRLHRTEEAANTCGASDRISCQPIKVTVQREKKMPVERSVSVKAIILGTGFPHPFRDHPECHDKEGLLTFTWTEEPTT